MSLPIDIQKRLVELGRIRTGIKGGKGQPQRLDTFRLTSASEPIIRAAADLYGGDAEPWDQAPVSGMWQVTTETNELDILLAPGFASYSVHYEMWTASQCVRRCDGQVEAISGEACQCDPDKRECKPTTRVNVMLPRLPGLGVWRFESGSYNVASEMPSTLALLSALSGADAGPTPGLFRIEQRESTVAGDDGKKQKRKYPVVTLTIEGFTIGDVISAGGAPAPAIAEKREMVDRPALPAAPPLPENVAPPAPEQTSPKRAYAPPKTGPSPTPTQAASGAPEPSTGATDHLCENEPQGHQPCWKVAGHSGPHESESGAWPR